MFFSVCMAILWWFGNKMLHVLQSDIKFSLYLWQHLHSCQSEHKVGLKNSPTYGSTYSIECERYYTYMYLLRSWIHIFMHGCFYCRSFQDLGFSFCWLVLLLQLTEKGTNLVSIWALRAKSHSTITTHLSSLLITSICCCNNDANVCASPPTPLSSDVSLSASLSMSDNRFVSNAMATFFSTLSCSSFCHSCSLSVNTRLGESSIPARPFVSRLTGSLQCNYNKNIRTTNLQSLKSLLHQLLLCNYLFYILFLFHFT